MFLNGFSLGCLTIIFVLVFRDFRQHAVARVFLALLFAVAVYMVRDRFSPQWSWLAGDIMTTIPALIWLLCQLAFARKPQLKSGWSFLALYSFVTPALTRPFGASTEAFTWLHQLGWNLPRYAEYIVILHGMWVIVAYWKDDLIESRRQLRAALLSTLGISALWVTISMNTGHGSDASIAYVVAIATILTGILLLQGREGVLLGANTQTSQPKKILRPASDTPSVEKKDEELTKAIRKLEHLMDMECFYRTEKLTLKVLAKRIALPEYKLRTIINQTFQYRNFNDYVNQLRIEEACERLINEPDTPIQNIALDVGYRTLSSFNRAFREIENQTPTDYRLSKLQQISKRNERQ